MVDVGAVDTPTLSSDVCFQRAEVTLFQGFCHVLCPLLLVETPLVSCPWQREQMGNRCAGYSFSTWLHPGVRNIIPQLKCLPLKVFTSSSDPDSPLSINLYINLKCPEHSLQRYLHLFHIVIPLQPLGTCIYFIFEMKALLQRIIGCTYKY